MTKAHLLIGFVFVNCVACTTGPGEPGQSGDPTETQECSTATTEVVAATDDQLGFDAMDVLSVAADQSLTLEWLDASIPYTPESGMGMVNWSVTGEPTTVRIIHQEPNEGWTAKCPALLEVVIPAKVTTGGGALNEAFEATLRAESMDLISFHQPVDYEDIAGAFRFAAAAIEDFDSVSLGISGWFTPHGSGGNITGFTEETSGSVAQISIIPLARWPNSLECISGYRVPLDGETSLEQALASPLSFSGISLAGSPLHDLTVTLSASGTSGCFDPQHAENGVTLPTIWRMESAEPLFDKSYTVRLEPVDDENVAVHLDDSCGDLSGVEDFESQCGDYGLDLSAYDGGVVQLDATIALGDPSGIEGTISILGTTIPPCVEEAMMGTSAGSSGSIDPCPGIQRTMLATYTLTNE